MFKKGQFSFVFFDFMLSLSCLACLSVVNVLTLPSPGRWFATHLLKMLLAYITLNYDMEALNKRPLNEYYGDFDIPSQSATIKVRRRKGM